MIALSPETEIQRIVELAAAAAGLQAAGNGPPEIAVRLAPLIESLDQAAWAAAEDELLAAGVRRATVSAVGALRAADGRTRARTAGTPRLPGHPLDTLIRENDVIRKLAADLSRVAEQLESHSTDGSADRTATNVQHLQRLTAALEKTRCHQARVLDVLLPHLERRGLRGLTRTLWAYYNGVRSRLAALRDVLVQHASDSAALRAALAAIVPALLKSLHIAIDREEQVLAPLLLRSLSEREWATIWHDARTAGPFLVEPRYEYAPPDDVDSIDEGNAAGEDDLVQFPAGRLTHEQLRAVFAALPVDLTFVDDTDAVCMFTESPDRVFPRNRGVLGRRVHECHPPKSIRRVERILSDFRAGRRDVAEFWLNHHGRFVHVRYFAVRDPAGRYLGTLELAQDLTRLRSLEGEQRLEPDDEAAAGAPP